MVEKKIRELTSQARADCIRKYEGVEDKAIFIRAMVKMILREYEDLVELVKLFDLEILLGSAGANQEVARLKREVEALTKEVDQYAFTGDSPKDVEMIVELKEEVKDKKKEIKRLGDGWSDSEEILMGLRNIIFWKEKENKELKESAQKTEQELEDFWAVMKAEAEEKNRLGLNILFNQMEGYWEIKKIKELQREKKKME